MSKIEEILSNQIFLFFQAAYLNGEALVSAQAWV
jgi:hypothetical protein